MAWRPAAIVALALVVGLAVGHLALVLILFLGVYLGLQLRNLHQLDRWLTRRRSEFPPDIGGPWGRVIATTHRIYRRKQFHKQRVRLLLREFRRLTSAMPDGAVLLGQNNEILWFNPQAALWLGLRRKRDFGLRIENLVRHPEFALYLGHGAEPGNAAQIQHTDSLGAERWLSLHLVDTQDFQRRLLIIRDVTREVRIESVRKDFVANASHELRSPLTVVAGYLDTLADETGLDPAWNEPVREMRQQAERMRRIIDDLLELSRLEEPAGVADERPVDVNGLLAMLRKEALALEQRPRSITVTGRSKAFLLASETQLNSIFTNLLFNAVKYTPAEGSVEMSWWVDSAGGHVAIRDTGIGIAAEHIPRLTERFYRVDPSRSRSMGGSGLGLAIVKHALQRHSGSLAIESEEGKGSVFTCHFPLTRVLDEGEV